ncbi:MAG: hypothetical protein HYV24_01970 [Deltaproteobacteria bacterium]|nr:hypothetical protein [Deltaproteobacteria bacterium]
MKRSFIAILFLAFLMQACGRAPVPSATERGKTGAFSVSLIPEAPRAGDAVRAVVTGGNEASFRWERNGEAMENAADVLDTSGFRKGERVGVVVTSGGREASAESILLNSPPVIRSIDMSPKPFNKSTGVKAVADGRDPDNDAIEYEYEWYVNNERVYEESGAALDGRYFKRGDAVSVLVVSSDREGSSEFRTDAGAAMNAQPRFVSVPPDDFSGLFIYTPKASDHDGDEVKFSVVKGPEGMKMEGGRLEWDTKGRKGAFGVVLSADDGNGGEAFQRFELKVDDEK